VICEHLKPGRERELPPFALPQKERPDERFLNGELRVASAPM
jgi:hypothetical protein